MRILKFLWGLAFWAFFVSLLSTIVVRAEVSTERIVGSEEAKEEKISEIWMGMYLNGIKVGYSFHQEFSFLKDGKKCQRDYSESWMKVSRLGGNPVEIITIQESLYDDQSSPIETLMRMKLSESETRFLAEITPDKIIFRSDGNIIKELPYEEKFYLGTPFEEIIEKQGLRSGNKYKFKVLDLTTHSLIQAHLEVLGKEDVLILGKKMNLWHIREEIAHLLPITMDEWIDDEGNSWKSISQTSFLNTTAIRMPKEKALEDIDENFDIAFSTIIEPNITFENPQDIQRVTFKLSGISPEKIKSFPYDDGSQSILEIEKDFVIVQTSSQIFKESEAIPFPVEDEEFQKFLKPTSFCQSDDPEIREKARQIVGREKNSWGAAKKIAEWVQKEMTPNYDVGFASAREILKNREGDCSEHTVLTVTLCRAVGIPARAAVGIMSAYNIFAYHMWPEVYAGRWIGLDSKWLAVDKKSGQYYTDATHLKFGRSVLDENIFQEMTQAISAIIGQLKLEIIDYHQDQ
jgi:transglutaminase-like putative cysteine protease